MKKEHKERRICKCECGGIVRGVESFGRLWTWCEKCTPVVNITIPDRPGPPYDLAYEQNRRRR